MSDVEATAGQLIAVRAAEHLRRLCAARAPVALSEKWIDVEIIDQMATCGLVTLTQVSNDSWTAHPTVLGVMINGLWHHTVKPMSENMRKSADELTARRKERATSYLDEFVADPANRRVFDEEKAIAERDEAMALLRIAMEVLTARAGEMVLRGATHTKAYERTSEIEQAIRVHLATHDASVREPTERP